MKPKPFTLKRPLTRKSMSKQLAAEIKRRQATLARERDELRELKDIIEDLIDDADTAVMHLEDAVDTLSKFQ